MNGFRLRELPWAVRVGLTLTVVTLAGGYFASLAYLNAHYAKKDEQPGLSMDDLVASFHGIQQPSPLKEAVFGEHGRTHAPLDAERALLEDWLQGQRIPEQYDEIADGQELAPADILDMRCVTCHQRNPDSEKLAAGDVSETPLDNWPDVKKVAFSREFLPVPSEILLVSTHTHAPSLALIALLTSALFWFSRAPRSWRGGLFAICTLGLVMDLSCMWLARIHPAFVPGIVMGGALFGLGLGAQWLGTVLELWLPRPRQP